MSLGRQLLSTSVTTAGTDATYMLNKFDIDSVSGNLASPSTDSQFSPTSYSASSEDSNDPYYPAVVISSKDGKYAYIAYPANYVSELVTRFPPCMRERRGDCSSA